tara:strand:- start:35 stop:1078 length:1044 start_codon:yes stop_codon:yes gene_type:complete
MPSGHNGPRFDIDTPLRTTAHWAITFLKSFQLTKDEIFMNSAERSLEYISSHFRKSNAAFFCRNSNRKDKSNGLIGQAWVIEALAIGGNVLKNENLLDIASNVFLNHRFNERLGLWHQLGVDGSTGPIIDTYNQQVWFALSGYLIDENGYYNPIIEKRIDNFLKNVFNNLYLYRSGLICHGIPKRKLKDESSFSNYLEINVKKMGKSFYEQSVGYHSFNLYAYSVLSRLSDDWDNRLRLNNKFHKALKFVLKNKYENALENNVYALQYNPTGIELAYTIITFSDIVEDVHGLDANALATYWLNKQFKAHFSMRDSYLNRNTVDANILSARLYEATRIPNISLQFKTN